MKDFRDRIEQLRKRVAEDPGDTRSWLAMADLHVRLGERREAIEVYERVADEYAGTGYDLKAIAVLSGVMKLDPSRAAARDKLEKLEARFLETGQDPTAN